MTAIEKPRPWDANFRQPSEPGPRMGNVRLSNGQFGTLFTGVGATFNFGEEVKKVRPFNRSTFESVYVRAVNDAKEEIVRYEPDGARQHVLLSPDGIIRYSEFSPKDLDLQEGELDEYSFTVGEGEITEILVVGWGDIPQIVLPVLPYHSLVDEFNEASIRAQEANS